MSLCLRVYSCARLSHFVCRSSVSRALGSADGKMRVCLRTRSRNGKTARACAHIQATHAQCALYASAFRQLVFGGVRCMMFEQTL